MPCQNGGTCVTNYKYDTFECHCDKGFVGEYCEKGRLLLCTALKGLRLYFRCLQSVPIFSILNHPCSFTVYYYLLSWGFLQFKGNSVNGLN